MAFRIGRLFDAVAPRPAHKKLMDPIKLIETWPMHSEDLINFLTKLYKSDDVYTPLNDVGDKKLLFWKENVVFKNGRYTDGWGSDDAYPTISAVEKLINMAGNYDHGTTSGFNERLVLDLIAEKKVTRHNKSR